MDETTSSKFSKSHAEFLQYLCKGLVGFNKTVIVTGHLYVTIDSGDNLEYVINEKLCKIDGEESINYISNSFPCFNDRLQEIYNKGSAVNQDDYSDDLEAESKDDLDTDVVPDMQVGDVVSQMSKTALKAPATGAGTSTDLNAVDLFKKTMLPLLEASAIKTELPSVDFSQDLQNSKGNIFTILIYRLIVVLVG